jgi:hypothetical protein
VETQERFQLIFFQQRVLKNLMCIDEIESLLSVMEMCFANLFHEETL